MNNYDSDLDSAQQSEAVVRKTVVVERDIAATFRIWTEQIYHWWPAGHSLSGDRQTQVLIEGYEGGRFYERTTNGVEHVWGHVLAWDPPHHLAHSWFLGSGSHLPTRVDVRFVTLGLARTQVEIEHRGPELIGDLWWANKLRYAGGWQKVFSDFRQSLIDKYTEQR